MTKLKKSWIYWRYLFAIILAIGLFFRGVNLDQKVYWYDETITSLRLAGYTKKQFSKKVGDGQILQIEDLQKYQRPEPQKNLFSTINSLIKENPEHPPLYYILARLWVQVFGYSVAETRSFSAAISVLAFPLIYWLCRELFESPLTGWVAIALLAVSPFHVLYAQEAREYALWTVTTLLSSAALLRAIRLSQGDTFKISAWGIYALTVVLGLYTHLLSVLITAGHGLYVFTIEKLRFSKTFIAYCLASLVGFIAFSPWFLLMIVDFDDINWIASKIPISTLISRWLINLSSIFADIAVGYSDQFIDVKYGADSIELKYSSPFMWITIIILIFVLYAIYFLCRKSPQRVWSFILILMGATVLPLLLQDLIGGGQRSSIPRYLIPGYLAIQVTVAYLLSTKITASYADNRKQKLWRLIAVSLISGGVVTCTISSQAETWWNKYSSYYNPQIASIINQANKPLVISSNSLSNALRLTSLSYQLTPEVSFLLVKNPNSSQVPDGFSDVFLFRPDPEVLSRFQKEQMYKIEPVHQPGFLWKLKSLKILNSSSP